MKKRKTPDLEKYLEGKKRRFVNYTQGAKIYKMSYWPFVRLAKKAEANYPIRKTAIVDLNILDDFLEDNPDVALVSVRPYKRKLKHEEAIRMIANGECGVFSKKLLQCFIAAAMQKEWIKKADS